jgi:FKBP-type peptidyl-prolyl cis-trans isomerase (trigger factor)
VSDAEVDEEIQRVAELSGEPLERVAAKYTDADAKDRLKRRLFEYRVIDFLAKQAVIDKRQMSLREFIRDMVTEK